jgi:membrane-associated phospholipid phosphatase
LGPSKVVAIAVLLLLAALLMASLITSDIGLWIVWSRLGDEEFYMVVAVMLYHFLPQLQQSLVLVIAVLFSGSLNIALKYTLNLPRPPNPFIEVLGPSFPSGHAQISSSFWSSFSLMTGNVIIAIISAIMVTGISLSRVFLRTRYAVDVVTGALIGCAVGYASYVALSHCFKKGSLVGYYVSIGVAVVLSAYNVIVLGAELGSSTALLGLSLAALTVSPTLKIVKSIKPSILMKVLASVISIALLLGVHMTTRGYAPSVRLTCFYVVGLCVFSMASVFQNLLKSFGKDDELKASPRGLH